MNRNWPCVWAQSSMHKYVTKSSCDMRHLLQCLRVLTVSLCPGWQTLGIKFSLACWPSGLHPLSETAGSVPARSWFLFSNSIQSLHKEMLIISFTVPLYSPSVQNDRDSVESEVKPKIIKFYLNIRHFTKLHRWNLMLYFSAGNTWHGIWHHFARALDEEMGDSSHE